MRKPKRRSDGTKKKTWPERTARKDQPGAAKPSAVPLPDEAVPSGRRTRRHASFPIAAVGASAGGLDALKRFLGALPLDSGIGFVLVPHLHPRHKSLMVELLSNQTQLPVSEARHGMAVQPNRIYVIPPNRYLGIERGAIVLRAPPDPRGLKPAIDFAFRSLAEDQKEAAICIILSGTGAYGTEGAKEIKLAGGLVIVQDPETAAYAQMPQSAVSAGIADYVLPPETMPAALIDYTRQVFRNRHVATEKIEVAGDGVRRVLAVLRARTKFDFQHYRKGTLLRRIRRRMALRHVADLAAYVDKLREDPDEITALRKDLLIGVTAFFRDADAFAALAEHVVPKLVERASAERPIRVWVPGCATGEEAYSIGMLLIERFAAAGKTPRIQIFSTDIDEDALEIGRQGIYPESIATAVSAERLHRFFTRDGARGYQVSKSLRDCVLFAPHSLIGDPPFSKLDLVSCRNVLIYLEPDVQAKVISLLHFALNDDGYLLLGPSETIGRATAMFEPISKKWRLYRRTGPARRDLVTIPIVMPAERRLRSARPEPPRRRRAGFAEVMQKVLAEEFAPASVLINRAYEILSVQGPLVNYVEFPAGEITKDLLGMARQGLRAKIRATCQKAMSDGRTVSERDARVRRNGGYVACSITVRPIKEQKEAASLLLVVFQDQVSAPRAEPAQSGGAEETALVRQLESELRATREDLQTIVEEFESSNEELKASNEEVMSMNEELQSANEELETSKEELQALNEELTTVNSQLQDKVEEIDKANSDLLNLIAATDIATVFLDTELRIKRFTPATGRLVNLMATDVGRPLRSFAPLFSDADLLPDAERVIATLNPIEKEIRADGDRWYLRRISPYRSAENRIGGVVITFVDVAQLRELNAALQRRTTELETSAHRIRAVLDAAVDAIISIDGAGVIETFNSGAEEMFGYSAAEAIGQDVGLLMPSPYREHHAQYIRRYRETGEARAIGKMRELKGLRKNGTEFPILLSVSEIGDLGIYTGIVHDITEQRALQQEVVQIATLEQRRIGQELHDGTQQELAGLGLLAQSLSEQLAAGGASTDAELAARLAAGIAQTNRQVRELSRGLVPMVIEAAGLPTALGELAASTTERHGLACSFESATPLEIGDSVAATHLYRIAQEAVGNAVKHARASAVSIKLASDERALRLEIGDDGVGVADDAQHTGGLGLRIMDYRCALIGGNLTVGRRDGGGTLVVCVVPRGDGPRAAGAS